MANKFQLYHHNKFYNATLWMKDAKEDGLKLILSSWKELIWFLKIVHHIKEKQKEVNVVIMKNVNHLLKYKAHTLLEGDGQKFLRNKWWKKYWWTVQFQFSFKQTDYFQHIKVVYYLKKELKTLGICLLNSNKLLLCQVINKFKL